MPVFNDNIDFDALAKKASEWIEKNPRAIYSASNSI